MKHLHDAMTHLGEHHRAIHETMAEFVATHPDVATDSTPPPSEV
jgi:hypothetical protein